MNAAIVLLLAVAVGAGVYAGALAAKTHLGEQRQQVAFILALTATSVALGLALLLAIVPTL